MVAIPICSHCRNSFPASALRCPHCALPGLFPNVVAADDHAERAELQGRYRAAMDDLLARGRAHIGVQFKLELEASLPVICRPWHEVARLASSDLQIYSTYYKLIDAETRMPSGERWDKLRRFADTALFCGYEDEIRFAALWLQGPALVSYGDCCMVLRAHMIAHRASVFEENSAVFVARRNLNVTSLSNLPRGYRATWAERSLLVLAKLAAALRPATVPDDFRSLLIKSGRTPAEDQFVEVHILGPMTIKTVERVVVKRPKRGALAKAFAVHLQRHGVQLVSENP